MGSLSGGGTSHACSYASCFYAVHFLFTSLGFHLSLILCCRHCFYLLSTSCCIFPLSQVHALPRHAHLLLFTFMYLLSPTSPTPSDYNLFASNTGSFACCFFFLNCLFLHLLPPSCLAWCVFLMLWGCGCVCARLQAMRIWARLQQGAGISVRAAMAMLWLLLLLLPPLLLLKTNRPAQ